VKIPDKQVGPASFVWWLPVLLFSAFIFYMSSQEKLVNLPRKIPYLDKVAHYGIYGIWSLLCALPSHRFWPGMSTWKFLILVGLSGTLYGISDEIHQSYVPGRDATTGDIIADSLGAFSGAAAFIWLLRVFNTSRSNSEG
jgi:VanZ family protein